MLELDNNYDVIVIGAGHAGCEAALASSRLGASTAIFTLSLDAIANMPCNPSIGGTAKGHIVCEIDALGGEMAKVADIATIQSRMLNRGKGPAVHSLRAQIDRSLYHLEMKKVLENQKNLDIVQAEVTDISKDEKTELNLVTTALGQVFSAKAVIIASGTFLKSTIFVGDRTINAGPDNMVCANELSASLRKLGINLRRFKTGTPARVHSDSIDYDKVELQLGDSPITPFSYDCQIPVSNKIDCYIAYTNGNTHEIIEKNISKSAMYSGKIEGVGPRYCPSIEDKVVRFADKPRHQLFIEPMGIDTKEVYLQGMSTSLPVDVQLEMYRSIVGLERVKIMRNAYAIEYDCCDPLDLLPTLEFVKISGIYGAGQFNGTSGYEEAAAQGLVAAVNAVRKIRKEEPLILDRASSYIGTLIDDLTTKGCSDPYRMLTSRSEYRLLLRQDNAMDRLCQIGYDIGLVDEERYQKFQQFISDKNQEIKRVKKTNIPPSEELNQLLVSRETSAISTGIKLDELLKRPQVDYSSLAPFDKDRPELDRKIIEAVEIELKYEGYIKRQLVQVEQMRKLEQKKLDPSLDYNMVRGLRLEACEKLNKVKPINIGQAGRISGVNPADITTLLIFLEAKTKDRGES